MEYIISTSPRSLHAVGRLRGLCLKYKKKRREKPDAVKFDKLWIM